MFCKMAPENKMAAFIFLFCGICFVRCHASSAASSSDERSLEEEKSERRNLADQNEWQYEGIPIDFPQGPSRRNLDPTNIKSDVALAVVGSAARKNQDEEEDGLAIDNFVTATSTVKSTTSPVYPPNNYRYRRIYNPDEVASIWEHKYVAALLVNKQLWCGAAIIDSDKVITAAHCLQLQYNNRFFREYVRMLNVRVGSGNATAGGELYRVTEIMFHPNYKPQTLEFNVAVLKLHKNISFEKSDPKAEKIDYSTDNEVPGNREVTFLGWGSVVGMGGDGGTVLLQKVKLPVYNMADCQEVYGRDLVTRSNFCAGFITLAKNVCNHDAGGPAVLDGRLIGVLSFSAQRCDVTDKPAVFTNIGAVSNWLEELRIQPREA